MSIGRVPGATGIQPSIVTAKGDLIVATASGSVTNQAVGSNNQVLMADSAQADGVKWANEATATLTTTGDILYASAANTPARLAIGSTNQVLTVSGGVPTWATASSSSGPAFRAFRTTSGQSTSGSVWTKVQLNGETFDTDNCFDSTTNYRFTPTKAGYYQLNATITYTYGGQAEGAIYKNGTAAAKINKADTGGDGFGRNVGTDIIYFNGSTDYVELYAYSTSGSTLLDNTNATFFSGVWIRS